MKHRHSTRATLVAMAIVSGSCSVMPSEFNLSPLYRHRLDENGSVLEMDVLWPLIHYETLADGGTDFRIRPFYRRVQKPDTPGFGARVARKPEQREMQRDHQFLWPLGRVRVREQETHSRLFPLWNLDQRTFQDGRSESDWYALFPFVWGGSERKAPDAPVDHYFGVFPIWLDAPAEFLTYDRLSIHFWPLHVRTEKDGRVGQIFLWPLIGYGYADDESKSYWYRFLPFFNYAARENDHHRYAVLWPFINWGTDLEYTNDPLSSFQLWPLVGWQTSRKRNSWSVLWPFFRGEEWQGKRKQLDLFWPFFHWLEDDVGGDDIHTWWLWPFVSRTTARHQRSWSFLWPLIWWREFDDSDGQQDQQWIVPFFKHVHRVYKGGSERWSLHGEDDYLQIWPLFHAQTNHDDTGEFAFPSPWFYRGISSEGVDEAYGWLYTVFRTQARGPEDHAMETIANLYTSRTRAERTQASVPFLFSYESGRGSATLYLLNCIPIRFGAAKVSGR